MKPLKVWLWVEIEPRIYRASRRKTLEVLDLELAAAVPGLRKAVLKERVRLLKSAKREAKGAKADHRNGL